MKRTLILIATALLFPTAFALTLPDDAEVTVTSETGAVVGAGDIVSGDLHLTIDASADGFVSVVLEGEGGAVVTFDGLIGADGEVLLVDEDDLTDLVASIEGAGGKADVTFTERFAGGVEDVGTLPQEAQGGIEGAIENQAAATGNAAAGQSNASADADESTARAGAEAEGRAETDADGDAGADAEAEGGAGVGAESSAAGSANADVAAGADVDVEVGEGAAPGGAVDLP